MRANSRWIPTIETVCCFLFGKLSLNLPIKFSSFQWYTFQVNFQHFSRSPVVFTSHAYNALALVCWIVDCDRIFLVPLQLSPEGESNKSNDLLGLLSSRCFFSQNCIVFFAFLTEIHVQCHGKYRNCFFSFSLFFLHHNPPKINNLRNQNMCNVFIHYKASPSKQKPLQNYAKTSKLIGFYFPVFPACNTQPKNIWQQEVFLFYFIFSA